MSVQYGREHKGGLDGHERPEDRREDVMNRLDQIESAICQQLLDAGECTFEYLVEQLAQFSWKEVLDAVDRLRREGALRLRLSSQFGFIISATPPTRERALLHRSAGEKAPSPFSLATS